MGLTRTRAHAGMLCGLGLLVAAALACAGVRTSQDYTPGTDFSHYRTFDWYPGGQQLTGDPETDNPFLHERIRAAIGRELVTKGYQKVSDRKPDLFVNYQLSVQQRVGGGSGIGIGYGVGSWGSGGGVGFGVGTSTAGTRTYQEGTLIIDLVDASSQKLVWRGTGSRKVGGVATPQETTAAVDEAVSEILKPFPPDS